MTVRRERGRPIGYYVHHHGRGHLQRALSVASQNPERFTLLGTDLGLESLDVNTVALPDDRLGSHFNGDDLADDRPKCFHYAPLNHDGVRARMAIIANWIELKRPSLIVSDVSVEVALLARLCSTPVVYVRLSGLRDDTPHIEAFRSAIALIAPFSEMLEDVSTPEWIRSKTIYAPGLTSKTVHKARSNGSILVVNSKGGSSFNLDNLIEAALGHPMLKWRCIGFDLSSLTLPPNLSCLAWSSTPEREIAEADVVIGGAGDGLVSEVLAQGRPFISIPDARPFDEQKYKARNLQRLSAAVVLDRWPPVREWQAVIDSARRLDLNVQCALTDPDGPATLYRRLAGIADA